MPNLCIIPARALRDPKLSGIDIRVLCAIGIHTDREGAGCWAYSRTLCEEANVGRSSFFDSTERLIEGGYIRRRSGKGEGKASAYSIILDTPQSAEVDGGCPPPRTGVSATADTPTINAPINAPLNATSSIRPADLFYRDTLILTDEYRDDWDALEEKILRSGGSAISYCAEMVMAIQGEHGYPKATPQQIGDAVRGFVGNGAEISFRLFKAYLRDSLKPKEEKLVSGGRQFGKTQVMSKSKTARVEATNLVKKLRECMVQATEGIRVGHHYLPADWTKVFRPEEISVIKTVGTGKLLSDDDTVASIALSDLANLLQSQVG